VRSPLKHICWVSDNNAKGFSEEMNVGKSLKSDAGIAIIYEQNLGGIKRELVAYVLKIIIYYY